MKVLRCCRAVYLEWGLASTPPCSLPPPLGWKARTRDRPGGTRSPSSPSLLVGKRPRAGSPQAHRFNLACIWQAAGQDCCCMPGHWLCLAPESHNLLSERLWQGEITETSCHDCSFSYNEQNTHRNSRQIPHACSSPVAEGIFFLNPHTSVKAPTTEIQKKRRRYFLVFWTCFLKEPGD